ncbi:MAG: hypothetical protein VXY16_03680 [Pseudomonadota bacterium]|nr:hypothetical protein [Pseudomonadota bacterium]
MMAVAKAIESSDKDFIKKTAKNILELDGQLAAARFLAQTLFAGIQELGGAPYFGHLERVANGAGPEERDMAIGYMHDLVEDIDGWEFEDVEDIGFDDYVMQGLRAVTKDDNDPYYDEMVEVGKVPQGTQVKRSDLRDNTNVLRLGRVPTTTDIERTRKYFLAWKYLTDVDSGVTERGTPFVKWMQSKPAEMQDWELVQKYSTEPLPPANSLSRQFAP